MPEIKLTRENQMAMLNAGYQNDPRFKVLAEGATQFVAGDGPLDAEVMFVGEAPGANEDRQGVPFCGDSGAILNGLLAEVGLRRANVYVTNIVKYRPPHNRTPTPAEVLNSMDYVGDEWEVVTPKLTVLFGATPVKAMFLKKDYKGMTEMSGNIYRLGNNFQFLPMFHPAYILRNRGMLEEYKSTWAAAYKRAMEN